MIQIQATISGYGGKACTLFSAYEADTRVLIVGAETEYRRDRRDSCVVLTNETDIERESLFTDDDLKASIAAFYLLKTSFASDGKSARLAFAERAKRASPESAIEKDGLDASGPKFRIAEGVTCGQIAALVTCLYAVRYADIERSVQMAESFKFLAHGGILTI